MPGYCRVSGLDAREVESTTVPGTDPASLQKAYREVPFRRTHPCQFPAYGYDEHGDDTGGHSGPLLFGASSRRIRPRGDLYGSLGKSGTARIRRGGSKITHLCLHAHNPPEEEGESQNQCFVFCARGGAFAPERLVEHMQPKGQWNTNDDFFCVRVLCWYPRSRPTLRPTERSCEKETIRYDFTLNIILLLCC